MEIPFIGKFLKKQPDDEALLKEWVEVNRALDDMGDILPFFDTNRALRQSRQIRASLSPFAGSDENVEKILSVGAAAEQELLRARAAADYKEQKDYYPGRAVQSNILAAQHVAEDILQLEGDVFAAVTSPIELGGDSEVWITCPDKKLAQDINDRMRAWDVVDTINAAWLDMETYSAFYLSRTWDQDKERPQVIHWSPKRIAVGPFDDGLGFHQFNFLAPKDYVTKPGEGEKERGDLKQLVTEFFNVETATDWNDWQQSGLGYMLRDDKLTWCHFMKPRHQVYPYPWLAKAATPVYTRQIIEEMRLALVQGVMAQLWVMTIDNPISGEVKRLKEVLATNRAERVGFLIWRGGLDVNTYMPQAIQDLLMPELWWNCTLDIFRRMGRTIRIVSGEAGTTKGTGGKDAEVDVQIAQRKAMAHRSIVAKKVVVDLIRQWGEFGTGGQEATKMVDSGKLRIHLSPIELFLGQVLTDLWGPMWDKGIASVHTIQSAMGLDTETETALLEEEKKDGYDELYVARQQFAQRFATPGGEVTRSPEPGRPPEGEQVKAARDPTAELESAFDQIDETGDPEERRRRVTAFITLLTALIHIHMRQAYAQGYDELYGEQGIRKDMLDVALRWEDAYITDFENDLMLAVDTGKMVIPSEKYRVAQHVQSSWKRGYMDGVFQVKGEQGWGYWRRVLRPWASKTGPCETCIEDSKIWHPITEPFWDHPYGVCSSQLVRFMRTSTDGWDSYDRTQVAVPLVK